MREYDLIADWYAATRSDEAGFSETMALESELPRGALVLDIGCGNGVPLTRALVESGHEVVGLDSSKEMLARFRVNCPDAAAVRGLAQSCPFADATFDAAIAWGIMWYLDPAEARTAFANISRVLKRGAPFLFTSGDVDGFTPKEDQMNGVTFRYFSFTADNYRRILGEHDLTLIDVQADSGSNGGTYYLARKSE